MKGSESIEIQGRPEFVYALVADMTRMGEWSPECRRVEWLDGATGPVVGAAFIGHNRSGPLRWSRRGHIVAVESGREIAFATEEGGREGTVWRYRFEPSAQGCVATESFEVSWIPLWARIIDVPTRRKQQIHRGMRRTLERIKTAAEAEARSINPSPDRVNQKGKS